MFMGEYQHALDDKGRLIVPAKFREGLGEHFVLTRGLDESLFAYPLSEWDALETKLRALPTTQRDARAFVRFFFSGATECEFDKQGRITIPATLRAHAQMEKDVVVVGVGSRVEFWAKTLWEKYIAEAGDAYESISEQITGLGL